MMVKIYILFIFLLYINVNYCKKSNDDIFVPTKEWREVKKGQKIPRGLHVRTNLQTGVTEAKLLDENEAVDKNVQLMSINNNNPMNSDQPKQFKSKYASYEELKQHLKELNLTSKSDSEVITNLITSFKQSMEEKKVDMTKVSNILEDIDFLIRQYDNGADFVKQNGFDQIIYQNLNSTNILIKRNILKLLASLLQNNIITKVHALDTGCTGILLQLLSLETDSIIKIRSIIALGALLRGFPRAQQKFFDNGGLDVISNFFHSNDIKIQIKVITLISDLIEEGQNDLENVVIKKYNWCENLNKLLEQLSIYNNNDHDSIEKCLIAMKIVKEKCGPEYKKNVLIDLERIYETRAINDVDKSDEISQTTFFSLLKDICNEILHYVDINADVIQKTEL